MSFLDDILDKGKTVVSSASKKTDTAVRFSKLKVKESQLNADIKAKNEKLGAVIYDMSKTGVKESEEFDALLAQIDEDYAKLAEVAAQLDAALTCHELVKVRFANKKSEVEEISRKLETSTSSTLVAITGFTSVFFRQDSKSEDRIYRI